MHTKRIGNHHYAYESRRVGGRYTSKCLGRNLPDGLIGAFAAFEAQARAELRAERALAKKRAATEAERDGKRIAALRKIAEVSEASGEELERFGRDVDAAVAAALTAMGYHRPKRGAWRRRMGAKPVETFKRSEVRNLILLARKGDSLAESMLAELIGERAGVEAGDLEEGSERSLIDNLPAARASAGYRADVETRLEKLRRELAPPGSGVVVELLASRAALDYLHVAYWEQWLSALCGEIKNATSMGRIWDLFNRNLDRATARYRKSLLAVARARRLSLPVVVGQLNVALDNRRQTLRMETGRRTEP